MKTAKRVKDILDKYPHTRNDDRLLCIKYLQEYYCEYNIEKKVIEDVLNKAPILSSMVRDRAYIQNNLGEYLPGEGCKKNRRKKSQRIRQEFREKSIVNKLKSYFPIFK